MRSRSAGSSASRCGDGGGGGGGGGEENGGGGEGGDGDEKKAKAKAKAKEKKEFEAWCKKVLDDTAYLTEGVKDPLAMPPEFRNYDFTGSLRPAYVTKQATVPPGIPKPDYADTSVPVSEQAARGNQTVDCKTGDDLEGMRLAGRLGREVLDIAARFLRVGVTGDEIDRIVHAASLERNCYPSPLNYYKFPKSVCVSPNEVICHGIPDMRPVADGDIINLDVTVYVEYKGKFYHGDLNETFLCGNCDEESIKLVKTAFDCREINPSPPPSLSSQTLRPALFVLSTALHNTFSIHPSFTLYLPLHRGRGGCPSLSTPPVFATNLPTNISSYPPTSYLPLSLLLSLSLSLPLSHTHSLSPLLLRLHPHTSKMPQSRPGAT